MLIVNGKIFTMEDECLIIEQGFVRINGKYIEEVGPMSELRPTGKKTKY